MGEITEERGGEDVKMENSVVKTDKLSPRTFTPDAEEAPTKPTTQPRSTRESTMTDDTDGNKKEAKSQSSDSETKSGKGTSATKMSRRAPQLFNNLPSATEEATKSFTVIQDSIYTAKYLGDSGQDEAMSCDCRSSWNGPINESCGEDSDCINRLTSMECIGSACGCGASCQNQRFQKRQYADVDVILTEKKGYGIRINQDTLSNTFIYEYVGEVIDEAKFRRRRDQYAKEGIKHFYFMSLGKAEFIDATRKGGLGRFCNHSCNPNCYVDKWVVGDKLRMGIFAKRNLKAGEELVFDYNVDRYGADPQACYCGEPNCIGYIGGKTQTEAGTKLSHQTLEALGLDDDYSWSTATAKKKKPKKGEVDDDYVQSVQPKALEASSVNGIMSSLISCKEKWIVIKLLNRIHASEDPQVQGRVLRLHGYSIMNNLLVKWRDENHIIITILEILAKWPRLTKNKISSSKIEGTVEEISQKNEDSKVQDLSRELLESWAGLQSAYRIPRRAPGVENAPEFSFDEGRRQRDRSQSPSNRPPTPKQPRNAAPAKPFNPPKGPANATLAGHIRQPINQPAPPPPPSIPTGHIIPPSTNSAPLPRGWWWHKDPRGVKFFYTSDYSKIQWNHPLDPSIFPQPVSSKKRDLDEIIQACQQEYAESTEAKIRKEMEKKAQEEEERNKKEEQRKIHEEGKRERKRKEYEAKKLKMKEDKFKNMEPALARKLIAKSHGAIAYQVANAYYNKNRWNWPKDDFKLLMKGFSYKLADRTLEKGGKYAEQPGIEVDKEYRARIEGHVKQWMKDERYCKKKLAQFRKDFSRTSADEESHSGPKVEGTSSQPLGSQLGSSGRTEDSPIVNGASEAKAGTDEESQKSTPASASSPRKRCREDRDEEAGGDNQELGDRSLRKRSKSDSPEDAESPPGSAASQRMETSVQPDSLPQSPRVTEASQLSLAVIGTPTKRGREEDSGIDGDIEMKDELEERVIKKVRSRSNSPSRGFGDGMRRQPAVVHTGA